MTKQWSDELTVFTRAFAGAAVFGIPLIFTMEMWWIGKTLSLWYLLAALLIGFATNLGLSFTAGFRTDHSISMSFDQAIDALAVGLVSAIVLLVSINQLRIADGVEHGVGMVILLAIPLSLGASVARQVFSGRTGRNGEGTSDLSHVQGILSDLGATVIGGVFIGISIAPTDEVKVIAAGLTAWHLFAIIGLSVLLSWMIVFASGFDEASPEGPFHHPFTETLLCYGVSIIVSLSMLLIFKRVDLSSPISDIVQKTIVLAVPVTIGGAGGRLVV